MEDNKQPAPAQVASAFVDQYYLILNKCPENLHKFYQERSTLGWQMNDGVLKHVTTLTGINEKIMSSTFKDCSVEVTITDSQESHDGGIMVVVTGCLTGKDNVKKNFSQTFFLAKQEKGFFVLNDILQIFDVCELKTADATGCSDDDNDQSTPTQNSAQCDSPCLPPTSLNFKAAIQNGKCEASEHSCAVSGNNLADGPTSTPFLPPVEGSKPRSVVAAPTTNEKVNVKPASNVNVKPASNVKDPSVATPPSHVALKTTYASVLAKQTVVPTTTKASSSPRDVSLKVSNPSGGVSKAPTGGQGATTSSAYTEVKGIYIGGLPYEITKQEIVDVVKQFGIVRRNLDDVQIRKHEDGFCCGFVEFESADSARRAVETHHVMFGDKKAYITYKRHYNTRGTNSRPRSPKMAPLQQNGSPRARENAEWTLYSKGQAKGAPRSSSTD